MDNRTQEIFNSTKAILTDVLSNMLDIEIESMRTNEVAATLLELGFDREDPLIKEAVRRTVRTLTDRAWIGVGATIQSLMLLSYVDDHAAAIRKGIEWLFFCQNEDGGIGRFDGDRSRIPVSWRTLKVLSYCGVGESGRIIKMIKWMEQEWSRDMRKVALTYKGAGVLLANTYYPGHFSIDFIDASVTWLVKEQSTDGGWSATKGAPVGSVPSYTAIALHALINHAERMNVGNSIARGIDWMIKNRSNGVWKEHPYEEPLIEFSLTLKSYLRKFGSVA